MSRLIKIIPFVLIIILFSCAEKEDCLGCNMNPKIKVNFEPVASKHKIDSLFTGVSDQIEKLVDSLSLGLTGAQRSDVQNELEKLREDSTNLNEDYTIFRSKKTKISELSAPGAVGLEIFQDTIIQKIALPVKMNGDTTTFYFSLHGSVDTLQLYYEREVFQDLEGWRMRLKNIGVSEEVSTFDSLSVKCNNRECSNDQTTVYIYY